jgi:hypothetical protein
VTITDVLGATATVTSTAQVDAQFLFSTTTGGTLTSSNGRLTRFTNSALLQLTIHGDGQHTYRLYLDGSDVGLSLRREDIDAFAALPDGSLLVSTLGAFSVWSMYRRPGRGSGVLLTGYGGDSPWPPWRRRRPAALPPDPARQHDRRPLGLLLRRQRCGPGDLQC